MRPLLVALLQFILRLLRGESPAAAPREVAAAAPAVTRLAACPQCFAQFDVTHLAQSAVRCRCGHLIALQPVTAVARPVERCHGCGALRPNADGACEYCGASVEQDAAALSLLCPGCYALNPARSAFCRACALALSPEPLPTHPSTRRCPDCEVRLFGRPLSGVPVEECPRCHGLWVSAQHFPNLLARAAAPARVDAPTTKEAPAAFRYRSCPDCQQQMARRAFQKVSGVVLDECAAHGRWLDAHELEAIAAFLATGAQARARLEALEAEQRRHRDWRERQAAPQSRIEKKVDGLLSLFE